VKRETREKLLHTQKFLDWYPEVTRYCLKDRSEVTERHYTATEIAQQWGISVDLARDTFRGEPGVLRFSRPGTRTKRAYTLLRVPESVLIRVHSRLTEGG
jgi:hypothetical protein